MINLDFWQTTSLHSLRMYNQSPNSSASQPKKYILDYVVAIE